MFIRLLLLLSLSAVLFGSGTYTGWRAARWLDPLLDAKDRSATISQTVGGWFDAESTRPQSRTVRHRQRHAQPAFSAETAPEKSA